MTHPPTKLLALLSLVLFVACGTTEKAVTLDRTTNHFPAKRNKIPTVLREVDVNHDTLKLLLVVHSTEYWLRMGNNLEYFDSVMTYDQLQTAIVREGLAAEVPSLSDKVGLSRAYALYKPFYILNLTKVHKPEGGWYAGLMLYDPRTAQVVFQNEIWLNLMWDGWTDQGTMFPLFNSLLDYLRKQKT